MFPSMPGIPLEHSSGFKEKHKAKFFEEVLRQKCLFKQLDEFDKAEWFMYMDRFYQECYMKDTVSFRYYNKECSSKILADFEDISEFAINECINKSFVQPGDYSSENIILKEDQ